MTAFIKYSKCFYKDIKKNIIIAGTFNRKEKISKYGIPPNTKGIYMLYLTGTNICVYVGETMHSISSRIGRHKKSMNDPSWYGEFSGRKIHSAKLQNKKFTIKYITAKDLKIKTKLDSKTAEGMIIAALKPVVYGENK